MTSWNKPQYDDDGNVVLTDFDILLGRGRTSFNHKGNRRFRKFIVCNVQRYSISTNRFSKSLVVSEVLKGIKLAGGRFLREGSDGKYFEVADKIAKEKIGHALRDVLFMKEPDQNGKKKRRSPTTKQQPSTTSSAKRSASLSSVPSLTPTSPSLGPLAAPASVTPTRPPEHIVIKTTTLPPVKSPLTQQQDQSSFVNDIGNASADVSSSSSLLLNKHATTLMNHANDDEEDEDDLDKILEKAENTFGAAGPTTDVEPLQIDCWDRQDLNALLDEHTAGDAHHHDDHLPAMNQNHLTAEDWDLGLADFVSKSN